MDELKLEVDDRIATLTIDRPARRNAMSFQMWSALPDLMSQVLLSGARVLVIRGNQNFSAGADISEFRTLRNDPAGANRYGHAVRTGERAIAAVPVPTIASINGFCIGGGCEIALACDVRIAASNATFGITPAKLGIVYSFTSTKQLVEAVGPAWAKQILYSGDLIDAPTALRIGLVNEVHDDVESRVAELAGTIATRARVSVHGAKQIVNRITSGQDEEDGDVRALYEAAVLSEEYAEGVAAFLAKRTPNF